MKKSKGFSLIESLVSITIASLLLTIVLIIYFVMMKNNIFLDDQMTLKEKSLLLTTLLQNAVEKAGFIGCGRLTDDFPIVNNTNFSLSNKNKITQSAKGLLTVRYASPDGATLLKDMRGKGTLYTSKNQLFSNKDILLISDCKSADIFIAKEVILEGDYQKISPQTSLSRLYNADAVVRNVQEDSYFIRDNILFQKNINQKNSALIEGMDQWQIQFNKHGGEVAGVHFVIRLFYGSIQKHWQLYVALPN